MYRGVEEFSDKKGEKRRHSPYFQPFGSSFGFDDHTASISVRLILALFTPDALYLGAWRSIHGTDGTMSDQQPDRPDSENNMAGHCYDVPCLWSAFVLLHTKRPWTQAFESADP